MNTLRDTAWTHPPDLSVIIVNYNAAGFLGGCLESVFAQDGVRFEVFVVDNASKDHSRDLVKDRFPGVRLIVNAANAGFARANNQALERAEGKAVFFLNPDTRVRPGALLRITQYLSRHPRVGIAGTRIVNPDGSLQSSVEIRYPGGRHGEKETRRFFGGSASAPGRIAWVLGASMAARREILKKIGGFDERFFLYGEDADICLRVRKAGYTVAYLPDAEVVHWGGESERGYHRLAVWEKKISAETLFFQKHYSRTVSRRIQREGLLQAYWRLLGIGLGAFRRGLDPKTLEKWCKYRAVTKRYRWNP
ncbi:MAG: glycosyltransferase family 2 protein [Deltaproteobacteria bacterium]|nr:glycosyltransferase family 2 protein [Deltaproteobacteria bacterium]MBW2041935.1 glycosyltransferase family 2 protein [Deltaproteobacteria bacterium]MBW2132843.1 glycosyltransferase family 2 protein [Deltaproteobacteria bacterium]